MEKHEKISEDKKSRPQKGAALFGILWFALLFGGFEVLKYIPYQSPLFFHGFVVGTFDCYGDARLEITFSCFYFNHWVVHSSF